jgi:hypothetical protein
MVCRLSTHRRKMMNPEVPVAAPGRSLRPSTPVTRALACLLVAGALTQAPAAQNSKGGGVNPPSKATYTGVTATFGCSGTWANGVMTTACASGDGVLGDAGGSYAGDPSVSTTRGAFLWTSGTYDDFLLKFDGTGGRMLLLDLSTLVQPPTCAPRLPCRKDFTQVAITKTLLEQGLLVRPANQDGSDLAGGMHKIAIGQTVPAKLKVNFPDPDGATMWWTLRYNPRDYPGSSFVCVTRTGTNTWTISAGGNLSPDDNGIAELVASPDGSAGRTQTHEGWYLMPFSLTVVQ